MKKLILLCLILSVGLAQADLGVSSAAHAANQGRIVFSKEEIKFEQEDVAKFEQKFSSQDPIYGRLYLSLPLKSAALHEKSTRAPGPDEAREGGWELLLYIDGEQRPVTGQSFAQGRVSDEVQSNWTTWQLNLSPDRPELRDAGLSNAWAKAVSGLDPGRHLVRLIFHATQGQYTSIPLAEGQFELQVAASSSPQIKASQPGPEPPPPMTSFPTDSYSGDDLDGLKQSIRKALVGPLVKSPQEIADVAVTSNWISGRYTHTKAEYRRIQATILWASKPGRSERQFSSFSFIQTKQGSGWSTLKLKGPAPGGPQGTVK